MVKQKMCLNCKNTWYLAQSNDSFVVILIRSWPSIPLTYSSSKNSRDYVLTLHMSGKNIYILYILHIRFPYYKFHSHSFPQVLIWCNNNNGRVCATWESFNIWQHTFSSIQLYHSKVMFWHRRYSVQQALCVSSVPSVSGVPKVW